METKFNLNKDWFKKENFDCLKNLKIPKGFTPKANGRHHYLDRNIAVLEFPTLDVELEAWRKNGDEVEDMDSKSTNLKLSYFICTKGYPRYEAEADKEDGLCWVSDNYANNYLPTINFNDKNWKTKLENEMYYVAVNYAKDNNYTLNAPNFDSRDKVK